MKSFSKHKERNGGIFNDLEVIIFTVIIKGKREGITLLNHIKRPFLAAEIISFGKKSRKKAVKRANILINKEIYLFFTVFWPFGFVIQLYSK